MSDAAIRVHDLGKRYRIGALQERDKTLREDLSDALLKPVRAVRALASRRRDSAAAPEIIWALRHVDFEVQPGEVVGVIGHNGAGKSTLLKILTRITSPTEGRVEIRGRVGSLLEVGTGFHQELTGRENVYMNGAILGMTRAEIDRKFDEIVAFSEVEQFIDTPVKHYSSGMQMRLAFAVAAHLEPEILLIDEVLAVGDAAFQRKCLGKMGDVASEGRTILFVSHNLAAVQTLCQRGILLNAGRIALLGTAEEAISAYLGQLEQASVTRLAEREDRAGRGTIRLTGIDVAGDPANPAAPLAAGRPAYFTFRTSGLLPQTACIFTLYDTLGQAVATFNSRASSPADHDDPALGDRFVCCMDELLLLPGRYRLNAALFSSGELQDRVEGAAFFDVEQGQILGRAVTRGTGYGAVHLPHRWTLPVR